MQIHLRLISVLILLGVGWGSTQALGKMAVSSGHRHFDLIFWQATIGVVVLGTGGKLNPDITSVPFL